MLWVNLRKGDLEALLDSLEHLLVLVAAHKGDGETLGTETTGTTDTVEVRVGIGRQVVVDGKVDTLNVDTTTEDVRGNADTLVELLELLVALDTVGELARRLDFDGRLGRLPLLLAHARVDRDGREVAFPKQLVQLRRTQGALDKDDDLVELKLVEKLVQLAVLLVLAELDVVLLETVQGQLGVLVDVVLGRVLHELLADGLDLVRQRGAEHHDLLLVRSGAEDLLDVTAHV